MKTESNGSGRKIALYIRVSTEEQAQNPEGSIKNQKERLEQTVELKNLQGNFGQIVGVYIDRAKSGGNTNRKALQEMLQAIKRREIDLVMASELSRISRSMKDFSEIWELMKAYDCGFQSLRDNFDTTTAAGEMVLYTIASMAQFERRQCSERVTANFKARAKRGLYNGGPIPLGYKNNPEKKGHLLIENEAKEVVKQAFQTFLWEETLSHAAKALNERGFKLKRTMEGGGNKARLDFFTIDNLHHILRNKTYVGIRTYKDGDKTAEVKGCWEPIIDPSTFNRVQVLLSKNKSAKKPHTEKRFPYLLTGLTFCVKCGNHLCGKSAHGRGGKVPYYEHGWATKRNSCLTKKIFSCDPHRVPAKKLEPLVVEKVKELLTKPEIFQELTKSFERMDRKNPIQRERERVESQIHGLTSQLDALAERLSQLPKGVSASTIFKQMEKIETRRTELQKLLREPDIADFASKVTSVDVKELFHRLSPIINDDANAKLRAQVIKRLIHKVEVGVDSVKIHYHIGERYLKGELEAVKASGPQEGPFQKILHGSSNSLTNGARGGT